jgi:hypothetical protein
MTCDRDITSDGWHFHDCGKPAKSAFIVESGGKKTLTFRCGVHSRAYRRSGLHELTLEQADALLAQRAKKGDE